MKLGTTVFVPVIASGLIAAGVGAGLAGADTTNNAERAAPFTEAAVQTTAMYSSLQGGNYVGTANAGDNLACTGGPYLSNGKEEYYCTDDVNSVTGYVSAGVFGK